MSDEISIINIEDEDWFYKEEVADIKKKEHKVIGSLLLWEDRRIFEVDEKRLMSKAAIDVVKAAKELGTTDPIAIFLYLGDNHWPLNIVLASADFNEKELDEAMDYLEESKLIFSITQKAYALLFRLNEATKEKLEAIDRAFDILLEEVRNVD